MANRTRYILEDTGRLIRETVTESEVDLKPDIMARYVAESTHRVRNAFSASIISPNLQGGVGIAIRGSAIAFTLPIAVMPLRARFRVQGDQLVPEFTSDSTPMVLSWVPPMRLYLLVAMEPGSLTSADQFLVALDASGRHYRLPTTNAYENCKLCTGEFNSRGANLTEVAIKAWQQFEASDWQADLSNRGGEKGMANSKLMFRFKPLEPEGFEQLPPAQAWQELCTKVSFDFITNFITV